jgi:hypothetical protein
VLIGNIWLQKSTLSRSDSPRIAALLDLRNASINRAVQAPGPEQSPIEIPRGLLTLTVNLPIGSEAGTYEVQIRKPNGPTRLDVSGQARIKDGITELMIELNTTFVPVGPYEVGWRMTGSDWRYFPIQIN